MSNVITVISQESTSSAHKGYNLNCQNSDTIPEIFHNLPGYDSHFLITTLATSFEDTIRLMPGNRELWHYNIKNRTKIKRITKTLRIYRSNNLAKACPLARYFRLLISPLYVWKRQILLMVLLAKASQLLVKNVKHCLRHHSKDPKLYRYHSKGLEESRQDLKVPLLPRKDLEDLEEAHVFFLSLNFNRNTDVTFSIPNASEY
ncbi:uncharacterized protein LOC124404997 [Diprion similis]|uniref:uncharacterized protein LOC124404997 n=1 Tax=Diprion similis TaxID=362088 RepID=UPI001EF81F25|nr:uncharacterized protein LOC124404997 [Diprion similis]